MNKKRFKECYQEIRVNWISGLGNMEKEEAVFLLKIINQQNDPLLKKEKMLRKSKAMKIIFDRINEDCLESKESFVPYSDIYFYQDQIQNIFDYSEFESLDLAKSLFSLSKLKA